MQERAKNHSLPFLCLTETWLKSYILDAQIHIPGYDVSRSDRSKRLGGGVLLYSHINLPISYTAQHDDSICQALFCKFDTSKKCVAVVYRPPDAKHESFVKVIQFLQEEIASVNDDNFTICITGDFNFSRINWENGLISPGGSSDESTSAKLLLQFMADNLYGQYVLCPTRKENTLDLFITNDDRLVANASATETPLSDHDLVDVMLSENPLCEEKCSLPEFDQDSFRSLDFHNADIERLRKMLVDVDWKTLRSHCSFEEFPVVFTDTLLQICQICCPRKKLSNGRPKALNALRRKKKRVLARYNALLSKSHSNPEHVAALQSKLALICYDIKDEINKSLDHKEALAVSRIKANPKYFFSYAKSLSKLKSSISMLFTSDGNITNDPSEMANILQDQFTSVFSDPNAPNVK